MHARDTSGSSRAASAGPDSGAVRQNSCFLLKGRETHKIKALSNAKPTDHLTFPTGFPLLVHKDGFLSFINRQLQFWTGTHTQTPTSLKPHFHSQLEWKQQQTSQPGMENAAEGAQCYLPRRATHCGDPSPWKMPFLRTKSVIRTALNYSKSQCSLSRTRMSWQTPPEPCKAVHILHSLGTSCIHSPAVWLPEETYRR